MISIVLLPGMDGTGTMFSELIASLPAGFEPIVVTYPTDKELGYEELESVVVELLPKHPFILVGESFSGPIAISLAASAPLAVMIVAKAIPKAHVNFFMILSPL